MMQVEKIAILERDLLETRKAWHHLAARLALSGESKFKEGDVRAIIERYTGAEIAQVLTQYRESLKAEISALELLGRGNQARKPP